MIEVIKNIIRNGEKVDAEFKEAKNKLPKSLFQTICAFLNRYGGNILLGVSDNRIITGVEKEYAKKIKKDFATLCNNEQKISPTIRLQMEEYNIDNKIILHINVPDSSDVHRSNGKIYDRNEDGDFEITNNTNLVSNMYIRKKDIHFEDKIFPYVTMDDLRKDLFDKAKIWALLKNNNHVWKSMTNEEIIKTSGLYRKDPMTGEKGLTLAAILLFGKDEVIMSCLSHFKTDAIYREENFDRYDDRDIIITNLIDTYTRLINFVQKHTNDKFFLEGSHSISIRDKIAREICSNLLIHRELSDGITSRIIITKDNIYTENPNRARFRGFITANNCIPYSKNPKIAKIFREIGLADELGSGVRNITKYAKIYSNRKPTFQEDEIFRVIIPLSGSEKAQDEKQTKAQDEIYEKFKSMILSFCRIERNIFEIMEYVGYKNRTRFRRDYIKPLVEKGVLKMTIPNKPTSKNQKYIVT